MNSGTQSENWFWFCNCLKFLMYGTVSGGLVASGRHEYFKLTLVAWVQVVNIFHSLRTWFLIYLEAGIFLSCPPCFQHLLPICFSFFKKIIYFHRNLSVKPVQKRWYSNVVKLGHSENRTRDLSHPKRESYH